MSAAEDVWMPSPEHGWLAGTATTGAGDESEITIAPSLSKRRVGTISIKSVPTASLVSRATPELDRVESDMTSLGEVSEAALLHNLFLRYLRDEVYTTSASHPWRRCSRCTPAPREHRDPRGPTRPCAVGNILV